MSNAYYMPSKLVMNSLDNLIPPQILIVHSLMSPKFLPLILTFPLRSLLHMAE